MDNGIVMAGEERTFWNTKRLCEMTPGEWESLCDGCGRCCLHKLEDVDTGLCYYTNVACHLLDTHSCRCRNYTGRMRIVADCLDLWQSREKQFAWLPASCAYRRLSNGQPLSWWHPLVSGDPETVHTAGISVRGRTVREQHVSHDRLEIYIIDWIEF
jgi:uncharacterized cysteine cluster protein YcgN (CxxCxxCC family)